MWSLTGKASYISARKASFLGLFFLDGIDSSLELNLLYYPVFLILKVLYIITYPMEKLYRSIHRHRYRHDLSLKKNKFAFYQLTMGLFKGNDREWRDKYFETAINTSKWQ